ncbi:MAG: hypothetical protein KatS3mg050_4193 [Litorilinea sp.]|nr:MAG: hypothetical protein KatS3mg050_4193 [Litorilinea sp.]
MPIILSLSKNQDTLWAAGPEGLFRVTDAGLEAVPQPQEHLYCCCAIHDRILVGGLPHGVAYSLQMGENWQAGWMDNVEAPVVALAPDPQVEQSGVLLAATDGGGILRTTNRGQHWYLRNFGLRSFTVLALAWAPPAPADAWPRWQYVFAATEEGVYHSPNGGRGWKRSECPEAIYQTLAVDPDFHRTGVVLAGTEGQGLFRSTDAGHSFQPVPDTPAQVNALLATPTGWLLSDESQLWHSADGLHWTPMPGSQAALVFLADGERVWAGNDEGVTTVGLAVEI